MPNKYSHALVFSNYQSHGLVNFDNPPCPKPASSPSVSGSTAKSARSDAASSRPGFDSRQSIPTDRLRLGSPTRPKSKPILPPLRHRSSSVETQIYAPQHSPTPPPTRSRQDSLSLSLETQEHTHQYQIPSLAAIKPINGPPAETQPHATHQRHGRGRALSPSPTQNSEDSFSLEPSGHNSQRQIPSQPTAERSGGPSIGIKATASQPPSSFTRKPNLRHSSAMAFGGQKHAASIAQPIRAPSARGDRQSHGLKSGGQPLQIPQTLCGSMPMVAQVFAPEQPPSPPATPDSVRSFSLETPIEKPDPITSPPPVPERSARRSPPGPSSRRSSFTSSKSNVKPEPLKPRTSPVEKSPTATTFSITTRTSSLNAATSPLSPSRTSSVMPKSFANFDTELDSLPATSHMPSQPFADDDADLESLPPTLDFDVIPWTDNNAGPAIFRDGELNLVLSSRSMSTRASSFDSVAPPPISLNRRMPDILTESRLASVVKAPEKTKPSLASLSFLRSAPKAILYSQTRPGTPPIPVSVSRTVVPSIPALFRGYKGQFPPQQKGEERNRRSSRDARTATQTRGRSVPPRVSDRRRSWFKTD